MQEVFMSTLVSKSIFHLSVLITKANILRSVSFPFLFNALKNLRDSNRVNLFHTITRNIVVYRISNPFSKLKFLT